MTTQIAEYSQTDAALAELKARWTTLPDANTKAGYDLIKDGIKELTGYRTSLESLRKDLKAPILERGKLLDSEAKRITAVLKGLEDPLRAAKQAVDEREKRAKEARIARLQAKVDELANWHQKAFGKTADEIREIIDRLGEIDTAHDYYDLTKEAMDAQAASLTTLGQMLEQQTAKEAEDARREEERRAMAEEQARLDAERQQMLEQQEALRRQQEEMERQMAAKRAELDAMEPVQHPAPEIPATASRAETQPTAREPMFKMPGRTAAASVIAQPAPTFEPYELTLDINDEWQRQVLETLVDPEALRALYSDDSGTRYQVEVVLRRKAVALREAS